MFSPYDFGYSWVVANGLLIPLVISVTVAAVALWRRWPRAIAWIAAAGIIWSATGLLTIHLAWDINRPLALPTDRFLSAGEGRVVDVGAGSGRAAIGVLLARPRATVTGLDIYSGYFGIDDNTPERFMKNARIGGVADRASTRTGDMRNMPFADGEFDAAISTYAVDHIGRSGAVKALAEIARVLKPRGEFLMMAVDPDWTVWLVSPPLAHHPRPDSAVWRQMFENAGLSMVEEGAAPASRFFLTRKRG
jgi:SAM-dependent methyltransferase